VRLSKCVSFGNGADIAAPELFDYAASDEATEVVVGYIESVRDGRALFDAIRRCARVKPTVLLKGGITAAGARAAQSHTGSLAGSLEIFEAMCRQAGALRVDSMDELLDVSVLLTAEARRIRGRRAILMGIGGGFSVLSADALAREGIELPELPSATQEAMQEYLPAAGNSTRNPIDATFPAGPRQRAIDASLRIAAQAPDFDALITAAEGFDAPPPPGGPQQTSAPVTAAPVAAGGDPGATPPPPLSEGVRAHLDLLQEIQSTSIPVVAVRRARERDAFPGEAHRRGVAVFPSIPRAARSIAQLIEWRERRAGLPQLF
jgi:acyl-CoA synthetase (NDP forming)